MEKQDNIIEIKQKELENQISFNNQKTIERLINEKYNKIEQEITESHL